MNASYSNGAQIGIASVIGFFLKRSLHGKQNTTHSSRKPSAYAFVGVSLRRCFTPKHWASCSTVYFRFHVFFFFFNIRVFFLRSAIVPTRHCNEYSTRSKTKKKKNIRNIRRPCNQRSRADCSLGGFTTVWSRFAMCGSNIHHWNNTIHAWTRSVRCDHRRCGKPVVSTFVVHRWPFRKYLSFERQYGFYSCRLPADAQASRRAQNVVITRR